MFLGILVMIHLRLVIVGILKKAIFPVLDVISLRVVKSDTLCNVNLVLYRLNDGSH